MSTKTETSADAGAYVNPRLQALLDTAEHFDDWPQACDAASERQRPIVARVGYEVAKVFPSRQCHTLYAGV
ncbi:MAG: hypothetical protein KDA32_10930 [Phycisphaerales bacterium]|nr:hypothetical protein [Phycisphaerales bacterium]